MGRTSAEAGHSAEPGEIGSAGSSKTRSGTTKHQQRLTIDGCPRVKTVEELLELAEDTHGWADEVRKLDPDLTHDQKSIKSRDANFTLDVSAPEFQMGAHIHDGGRG